MIPLEASEEFINDLYDCYGKSEGAKLLQKWQQERPITLNIIPGADHKMNQELLNRKGGHETIRDIVRRLMNEIKG